MAVSLRDFGEDDLPLLQQWARHIDSAQFMSRIMPLGNDFAEAQGRALVWSVILDDGAEVGAIWLERAAQPEKAVLGILLADTEYFGRGIGGEAIHLAVEKLERRTESVAVTLNVRESNSRAIACYEKCGFRVVTSGEKGKPGATFKYVTMERYLTRGNAT
jgi:RimJ/RimL family protein N-acetyltransferase